MMSAFTKKSECVPIIAQGGERTTGVAERIDLCRRDSPDGGQSRTPDTVRVTEDNHYRAELESA
jgi:hypothetical protein